MLQLASPLPPLGGRTWDRIAAIADKQSAVEFLWKERLYALLTDKDFPSLPSSARAELNDELYKIRTKLALRQAVRARDLEHVMHALQARGVMPVVLKGAALGPRLYPDAASRPSVDVDLLIAREDIDTVHEVFHAQGWVLAAGIRGHWVSSQWSYRTERSDALSTSVDIHWRLTNRPQLHHALSYQEVFRRAVSPDGRFPFAHTISSVHALVHAVVHLVAHHADEHIPVLWYLDIASLERSLSRGERLEAVSILRARGLLEIAAQVWQASALEIGFQPSEETAFLLHHPTTATDSWRFSAQTRAGQVFADLAALSWRARVGYLREVLFPPEDNLRAAYGDEAENTPLWRLYARRFLQRGIRRPKGG